MQVSLPWTLLSLHYHGIGAASRNVAEKFTRTDPRAVGAVPVSKPDNPEISLINSVSASLTIVLHESCNRAPKFLEFRQNFNRSRRRAPPQSRHQSVDLSGNLTADRPGDSDASERRPANKRENFPCRLRFIGGLEFPGFPGFGFAAHCWTRASSVDFFALHEWTNFSARPRCSREFSSSIFLASAAAVQR